MSAYEQLETRQKRIAALNDAMGILHWDQETMMPEGAAPARAGVLAELSLMVHELETGNELADLIAQAESDAPQLDNWQQANLREIRQGLYPCECDAGGPGGETGYRRIGVSDDLAGGARKR